MQRVKKLVRSADSPCALQCPHGPAAHLVVDDNACVSSTTPSSSSSSSSSSPPPPSSLRDKDNGPISPCPVARCVASRDEEGSRADDVAGEPTAAEECSR